MAEQNTLILPARLATAIIEHARAGWPEEVCGLVAGVADRATALYPGRNISPIPADTYELDHETLARMIDFEDAGLELIAIYHSHPRGPETPSPTDIANAYYSESVYLIVSLATPEFPVIRGFWITDQGVREISLESEVQGESWPCCQSAFDR